MKKTLLGASLMLAAFHAHAHTPYLHALGEIGAQGGLVSMEAAFAETFFVPEVAFDKSQFEIIAPDGSRRSPDRVEVWKARTLAEHRLDATPGTWRFSTGHRLGALFRTWEVDGKRESSRDASVPIPPHAKVIQNFQSLTLAETYLSVGEPNRTALAPRNKGLEIAAIDHPSDLYVGESFRFQVLFDGSPLANQKVEITEAVSDTGNTPQVVNLVTDGEGRTTFRPERAALWLALTRHRTPAPPESGVAEYSHSYTLTFRTLAQ